MADSGPGTVRRRTRTRWLLIGLVVLAVATVGTIVVLTRFTAGASAGAAAPPSGQLATVPVTKMDLSEQQVVQGTLGYGAEFDVTGHKAGTITTLPAPGTQIKQGGTLYTVDAVPVPLFYGALPFYRPLTEGMDDGPDVKILEQNLKALGFSVGTPDTKFTHQDTVMIKKWQKSLKLEQTGTIALGDVLVQPGPIRTGTATVAPGAPATGPLFKATGTEHLVKVPLTEAKQHLAKEGDQVGLTIGGKTTTGKVLLVANAPDGDDKKAPGGDGPKVIATITLDDQSVAAGLTTGSASVTFTTGVRKGVLTVPVNALLALAEGGNGLEVVQGGKHTVVMVKTGLFAGGKVEVEGDGIAEGTQVVTTS
ncbi:peptidoglycan-binding protein [Amycolatopsis sp. cg5]|uniref:peptidoglycan-binding protein n=1 Tax=Amycolatopsis sp. cg5 TaxID=3238802 RepID=UPI003524B4D5